MWCVRQGGGATDPTLASGRRLPWLAAGNAGPTLTCDCDAENRLVAVTPTVPLAGSKRATFGYDYLGRRVVKKVWGWNTTLNLPDWDPNHPDASERKFVWDG